MAFRFSDQHIDEYTNLGYTVFRGILPPSLITDLRRVCDVGIAHTWEQGGTQNQRFFPGAIEGLDMQPFHDYRDLPPLVDAVTRLLSERHRHGAPQVLIQPRDTPYCTIWHRDWRDNVAGLDIEAWRPIQNDPDFFNQINCALYEDSCTWIVPGSHNRDDTQAEIDRFPTRPIPGPDLDGKTDAERERICLEYCQSMPGAQRLDLNAGDFAIYKSVQWHIGNYLPYRRRATLHDTAMTPRFRAWWDSPDKMLRQPEVAAT